MAAPTYLNTKILEDTFKKLVDFSKAYSMPMNYIPYNTNMTDEEALSVGNPDERGSLTIQRQSAMDAVDIPAFVKVLYSEEHDKLRQYSDSVLFGGAYSFTSDYYKFLDTMTSTYAILRTITKIRMHLSDPYALPVDLVDEYLLSFGFNRFSYLKERDKRELLRTIGDTYMHKGTKSLLHRILRLLELPLNEVFLITYWIEYDEINDELKFVGVDDTTKEVLISEFWTEDAPETLVNDPLWQNTPTEVKSFLNNNNADPDNIVKLNASKTPYFSLLSTQSASRLSIAWMTMTLSLRREKLRWNATGTYPKVIDNSFGYETLVGVGSNLSLTEVMYSSIYLLRTLLDPDTDPVY